VRSLIQTGSRGRAKACCDTNHIGRRSDLWGICGNKRRAPKASDATAADLAAGVSGAISLAPARADDPAVRPGARTDHPETRLPSFAGSALTRPAASCATSSERASSVIRERIREGSTRSQPNRATDTSGQPKLHGKPQHCGSGFRLPRGRRNQLPRGEDPAIQYLASGIVYLAGDSDRVLHVVFRRAGVLRARVLEAVACATEPAKRAKRPDAGPKLGDDSVLYRDVPAAAS
jgi:hypothetical protein